MAGISIDGDGMFSVVPPAGLDAQLLRARITEQLGSCYRLELELLADQPLDDESAVLGKSCSVSVRHTPGAVQGGAPAERHFHGHVTHISHAGMRGRRHLYEITAEPWLALLQLRQDCRIYQDLTAPQILQNVFSRHAGIAQCSASGLSGSYPVLNYCVQYNESDFDFVARLMAQEGIYYHFDHSKSGHTLKLCDSPAAHQDSPGFDKLPLRISDASERRDRQSVTAWSLKRQLTSGAVALTDYDFERPRVGIGQQHADDPGCDHGAYEVFEYPGQYIKEGLGEDYARKRLQARQAHFQTASASTSTSGLACGATFTLQGHPNTQHNRAYLVTSTRIEMRAADYEAQSWSHGQDQTARADSSKIGSSDELGDHLTCSFTCIEALTPYRNAYNNNTNGKLNADKPKIPGPQTAVVTGPAGEEIYTDNHGRIKVKFHWDRYNAADETSSCWIRVSQAWAGKSFGFMAIPRIGQEVIVDFLNGDPDCPLITGRVYNAEQTPPWPLPANKTQTGILTRSFEQGAYSNANALRFEDKRGAEQLWLHAEKDQLTEVENDEDKWVGRDRRKTIDRDETNHIKRDRTETVDHDETITVHNDRTERVDHNETISIGDNRTEDVGKNETIDIGKNRTETVGDNESVTIGKHRRMTVGQSETLSVGTSKTDSIGSNHRISIGKMKTETIGMAAMENVGLAKMLNVGLAYSINTGGMMSTIVGAFKMTNVMMNYNVDVGKAFKLTAGDSVEIVCGKSTLRMDKDGNVTINGNKFEFAAEEHAQLSSKMIDLN